jgi:DNA-binding GntR family transcriptional regulator
MNSKKDEVYKQLRYRIITHDLKPMQSLNEKALMDCYSLGRTPMREVLLKLQNDGLIQRFSRSGTVVSPVDIREYKQNIEVRIVLEELAGKLGAEKITEEQLEGLRQILKRVRELEKKDNKDLKELMQCEFDFHGLICEATHNPKLIEILHNLQGVTARFWHYQIFSAQELLDQFSDHTEVLNALEKRDGQRTGQALKKHIQNVLEKLKVKVLE